jgi:hypothetical protein
VRCSVSHERVGKTVPECFTAEAIELLSGERTTANLTSVRPPTENITLSNNGFESPARELACLVPEYRFGGLPALPWWSRQMSGGTESLSSLGSDRDRLNRILGIVDGHLPSNLRTWAESASIRLLGHSTSYWSGPQGGSGGDTGGDV